MRMISTPALGKLVVASVLYQILVLSAMHFLEPEFSPIKVPMSAYVVGAYGPLMTTTYFVLSAGVLAVAYGLVTTVRRTRRTKMAFAVLVVAALACLLAGIFPMDFPPRLWTFSGRLHALGGVVTFLGMTVGVSVFSLNLRHDGYWRGVSAGLSKLSAVMIAAVLLMQSSILLLGYGGYAQRLFMIALFCWMADAGLHLIRTAPAT
jgi:hypothetical membrane protein